MGISARADRIFILPHAFPPSLVLVSTSTLCLALGTTLPVLLFSRLLQGLSTAIVATIGYILICEAIGQEILGCAMAFSSVSLRTGLLLGYVISGLLYEYESHHATFLPVLVLAGEEIALRMLIIEDRKEGTATTSGNKGAESGMDNGAEKVSNENAIPATETQPLLRPPPRPMPPQNNIYRILLANSTLPHIPNSHLHPHQHNERLLRHHTPLRQLDLRPRPPFRFYPHLRLYPPYSLSPPRHRLPGTEHVAPTGLAIDAPSLAALSVVGPGTVVPMLKMGLLLLLIGIALAPTLVPLQLDAAVAVATIAEQRPSSFWSAGVVSAGFGLVNVVVAARGMAVTMGALNLLAFGLVVDCMNWREM